MRICLCVLIVLATHAAADPVKLYVAPNGNDGWTGATPAFNANNIDGPFATLNRARDEARKRFAAGADKAGGVTIFIRGGTYFLRDPLVLMPEDSGAENNPMTWAAYEKEIPILSGGVQINGWKPAPDGRWQVVIPEIAKGEWNFTQLFVNDGRRLRPRLPKKGYYYIAGEYPQSGRGKGFDRFRFNADEIKGNWKNLEDVELYPFGPWFMPRQHITAVDDHKHVVTLEGATGRDGAYAKLTQGLRFLVENVAETQSEPGEFYVDRKTGGVSYVGVPGEDLAKSQVIAPRLEKLLILQGDAAKGAFVHHLVFRGIVFEHTQWQLPKEGYNAPQAEVTIPGAIFGSSVRDCVFDGCTICRTGTYGIELANGCKRNRIENCVLSDLGAGGIKIGEQRGSDNDELLASHNVVRNCLIAHAGRTHPAGIGVWIGQSHSNTVEHCEIFDLYYSTLSSGWTWGYGKSFAHDNHFLDNKLYHIGQNVLSDMGAFYSLGISPGTIVRGNRIDDVESYTYGGWGLYTDEGSTGVLMENNLVTRTKSGGFHQHYGKDNHITNNIFLWGREQQLKRTRKEDHLSFTFDHNVVMWDSGILFDGVWKDAQAALDFNCYWRGGKPIDLAGMTFEQWQKSGHDPHSIVADPGFAFAPTSAPAGPAAPSPWLTPDSAAVKQLGIKPFDVKTAGLLGPLSSPAAHLDGPFPPTFPIGKTPPPAAPPQPIIEDFEDSPVGAMAIDARTSEDKTVKKATARVTDETAAGGKHSLKFTDLAGQKANYTPMVAWQPRFSDGVLVGSFDLRIEAGAEFAHEWRTDGQPFIAGPSIRIKEGVLTASGKKMMDIPTGKWVRIEITAGIGAQADGKWTLAVTLPDAEAKRFEGLTCKKEFNGLRWFGFISAGTTDGVFYLDNVELRPR